jgi:hypothetical protein
MKNDLDYNQVLQTVSVAGIKNDYYEEKDKIESRPVPMSMINREMNKLSGDTTIKLDKESIANAVTNATNTYRYNSKLIEYNVAVGDLQTAQQIAKDTADDIKEYKTEMLNILGNINQIDTKTKELKQGEIDREYSMALEGYTYVPNPTALQELAKKKGTDWVEANTTKIGGKIWIKPVDENAELQKLLSPTEAKTLGVPYGTTKGQAANMDITIAGKKITSGGGGSSLSTVSVSSLSPLAKNVYENPAIINNLTPTEKGKILKELSANGLDLKSFGLEKVNAGSREQIAQYDDLQRQADSAMEKLDAGLNTGPIASRVSAAKAMLGGESDFTKYRSVIDNMSSALLKLRSGAAVTPQEFERIAGFIPNINDDEKTAKTKIAEFKKEIASSQQNYIKRLTQSTLELIKPASDDPLGIR